MGRLLGYFVLGALKYMLFGSSFVSIFTLKSPSWNPSLFSIFDFLADIFQLILFPSC